jgi:hypothetical protein
VPFNFCSRSVMLYVVHQGHQDYRGGQAEIVHLVTRVSRAVANGRLWAFTDRHAELGHALYYETATDLDKVSWQVMSERYWIDVKEERQAEFLVKEFFPWDAILGIAVMTQATLDKATQYIQTASHQPSVVLKPDWYY